MDWSISAVVRHRILFPESRERFAKWRGDELQHVYGVDPRPFREALEASQWWDRPKICRWQETQLTQLARHAYAHSKFYRHKLNSINWSPKDTMTLARWSQLPILTKEILRTNADQLRTHTQQNIKCHSTSGTTGTPVRVWREARYLSYLEGVRRRAFSWFGVDTTSPTFYFGGAPHDLRGRLRRELIDLAISRRCLPAYEMSASYLDSVIDKIRSFRPATLCGYTSALYALAQHADRYDRCLKDVGLRMVLTMSELTQPWHTDLLHAVTAAPVTSEYGCVEIGGMAYTCPHGTNHISHDHVLFEIVDEHDQPCQAGRAGRVVLTPLTSYEMPLLRYDLGDQATLADFDCPCGRQPGATMMMEISGRSFDQIVDQFGKTWNGILLYYTFKEVLEPSVFKEFQGVQRKAGELELNIIPGQGFSPQIAQKFSDAIQNKTNGALAVGWKCVSSIDREKSAKFKYFKSTINRPAQEIRQ